MRARLAVTLLLLPSFALAANYEVPLDDVDDEDDIIALEESGDISADTAEILLEMIVEGVDLNTASRDELYNLPGVGYSDADAIILYRKNKGKIEDPTELVGAGALTDAQLRTIAPFVRIESTTRLPISGKFRLRSAMSNGDFLPTEGVVAPPALLSGRLRFPWDLSAGFTLSTTRQQPGSPRYDATNDVLVADPLAYRPHLTEAFAMWKSGQRKVVVGTFTAGFAERLTLDNTRRYTPVGIYPGNPAFRRPILSAGDCRLTGPKGADPCSAIDSNTYITPDFVAVRQGFRGIAGSLEDLELGDTMKVSMYAFLSYQTRNLYQYLLYSPIAPDSSGKVCQDPRDPACSSPSVYVGDPTDGIKLKFATLPDVYEELVGAAHADFKPSERFRIGLTGFGAKNFFHATQLKLDVQETAVTPFGGPFGAFGLNGSAQFGDFGFYAEATRSLDSIQRAELANGTVLPAGGGGYAVEQRTVFSPKDHELELSLRYYDGKFDNPYARPISAPDLFEGTRARNELGARLKYYGKLPADFELRASANLWMLPYSLLGQPPAGTVNLITRLRVDYVGYRVVQPAIWFDMNNKNLSSNSHFCPSEDPRVPLENSPYTCGDLYRISAQLEARPFGKWLSGSMRGSITWLDDSHYKTSFRQDARFAAELVSRPLDFLQLKVRTRYLFQDISDTPHYEQSLWSYLQASFRVARNFHFELRYDLYLYLDQRASTLARSPNPEHRFYVDISAGF